MSRVYTRSDTYGLNHQPTHPVVGASVPASNDRFSDELHQYIANQEEHYRAAKK